MRIRIAILLLAGALAGLALSGARHLHDRQIYQAVQDGAEVSYILLLKDPEVRPLALYNLANAYLRQGVQEGKIERLRQAVAYYRAALREEPTLLDAKKNYEIASHLLTSAEQSASAEENAVVPDKGVKPGMVPGELDI